jgi:hypothetical protein
VTFVLRIAAGIIRKYQHDENQPVRAVLSGDFPAARAGTICRLSIAEICLSKEPKVVDESSEFPTHDQTPQRE